MQSNQNVFKNILIFLIILVVGVGIYFGVKFYQISKNTQTIKTSAQNKDLSKTPFQTRTATSGEVVIIDNQKTQEEAINPNSTILAPVTKPRLVQLWKEPVSGFDFINKDKEILSTSTATTTVTVGTSTISTSTIVYKKTVLKNLTYIYLWDRATGNIHENLASTSAMDRVSNYTLPSREEVYFIDSLTALVRGVDASNEAIQTTYIKLFKETGTSTMFTYVEKNIPVNSKQISVSSETKKMFYFIEQTGQAIVANLDMSSFLRVLNTSLTQWIPQYVNKTTLAITTKPSAYFQGYLFFTNSTGNGDNQYILGDKYGFTTLVSPDGKKVLYSEIQEDLLQTSIYDISKKQIVALTQSTLTEKCSWTNDSKKIFCAVPQKLALAPYPDVWYQGSTSFTDNIWSINPETGEFTVEVALQDQVMEPIDAYNLKISKDNKYLLFQNKYNLSLWKYDL